MNQDILLSYYRDPILCARQLLPEQFFTPMPWVHRGIIAILLRSTDFLLNFGKELWGLPGEQVLGEWTPRDLEKLARCFVAQQDPSNPASPKIPIFHLTYDLSGEIVRVDLHIKQNTALVIPRGFSKTTIVNFCNFWKTVFKEHKFGVNVSKSQYHAELQLGTIKQWLRSEAVQALFGNILPGKQDIEKNTHVDLQTLTGINFVVRGTGAQIRGMNIGGDRPDNITIDDAETWETVASEEQTNKIDQWLRTDVAYALPRFGTGTLTVLGTYLGAKSMLAKIMIDPRFTTVVFGAVDPEGEPLWEHAMSLEKIQKELDYQASQGRLPEATMELLSTSRNEKDAKFKGPYILHNRSRNDLVAVGLALDPAISKKKGSDPTALAAVGMTADGFIHVLDVHIAVGMNPREQMDKFFEFHFRHRCTHHGIEAIAYQAALIHLCQEEMFRYAQVPDLAPLAYFEIVPITHGVQRKVARVEGALATRYAAGVVTHQRTFSDYFGQLDQWPHGKKDGPDVVAMALSLLTDYTALAADNPKQISGNVYEPLDETYWSAAGVP